jgi:hypothetical protein
MGKAQRSRLAVAIVSDQPPLLQQSYTVGQHCGLATARMRIEAGLKAKGGKQ